ncbi:MAG: glycosyltransferase family 39 protein [Oscillospiraceae bacterium]
MEMLNQILLAMSVFLTIISAAAILQSQGDGPEFNVNDSLYKAIFVFFALAALFIRIYKFGQVPGGFNQDGAMAAVDAKALADYGTDRYGMSYPVHLTAWGYSQMSALLSYLMVPFIKLMGLNAVSARLPQLIISLLGLAVLYLFSRDAFGKKAALVVFAFGSIAPWHILQSRWALDCNLYPHFFLFGIYFLNRSLEAKHRKLLLCISMVMFGLCMYCYGVSIYTMPLFLLMACVYLLVKKQVSLWEALMAFVVWMAVAWPFILVMAINFFKWDTIELGPITMAFFPDSVRSGDILFFSNNFFYQLYYNIWWMIEVVFCQYEDLPWNNIPAFGSIYLFSLPFAVLGFAWILLRLKNNHGAVLLLLFFITGLWCGICTNGVNINRINIIFYPQIIFTALGIYAVLCRLRAFPLRLGIAAAYLMTFSLFCNTYFGSYAQQMAYYFDADFCQAVSSVKDDDAEKLYITSMTNDGDRPNISEILTLFYHETDAEYYQGKTCPEGLLPFGERYTFARMEDIDIDPEEDAAYVAAESELDCFDLDLYDVEQYGSYYVLERKD